MTCSQGCKGGIHIRSLLSLSWSRMQRLDWQLLLRPLSEKGSRNPPNPDMSPGVSVQRFLDA